MKKTICLLMIVMAFTSCTTHNTHLVPFKPPSDYTNYQNVSGLLIGAEAFSDGKKAEQEFGFNVLGSGLLPVKIVIENKTGQGIELISGQTFIIDTNNRYLKVITNRESAERARKYTAAGTISGSTGKAEVWGSAAGALLKHAVGISSSRESITMPLPKDTIPAGTKAAELNELGKIEDEKQRENKSAEYLRDKGIEGKIMPNNYIASGFLYFPGDNFSSIQELRLQFKFRDTGRLQTINLKLK